MDSKQPSKSHKEEEADWDKPPPYSAVFSGSAGDISAAIQGAQIQFLEQGFLLTRGML
jgi:hypothetical protein